VNTQRPARQIWLAADARAWHFSWDPATRRWLDDKGRGDDLFATIGRIVKDAVGVDVAFA
jgi:CyaY protein